MIRSRNRFQIFNYGDGYDYDYDYLLETNCVFDRMIQFLKRL